MCKNRFKILRNAKSWNQQVVNIGRWNLNRCHVSVLVCESVLGEYTRLLFHGAFTRQFLQNFPPVVENCRIVEKNCFEQNYNNFGNFFIFEKNSVEIWLIFEKKNEKNFEKNFWKKIRLKCRLISVNRWLIGTSVKISVDLGYFRLKYRLHNLPGSF